MKTSIITALLGLLILNPIFSQTTLELNILDKNINYFRRVEDRVGGKLFRSQNKFISDPSEAQPEIYVREEKLIPSLLVYYTFLKKDSMISQISYEWDVYNFDKKDNNIQSSSLQISLIEKYNSIITLISTLHGNGTSKGSLDELRKINEASGLRRSDLWLVGDSLKIYSYITISNFYKETDFVTVNPTHRIRVYVYNLKRLD